MLRHDVTRFGALTVEVTPLLLLDLLIIGRQSTIVLLELYVKPIPLVLLAIGGGGNGLLLEWGDQATTSTGT